MNNLPNFLLFCNFFAQWKVTDWLLRLNINSLKQSQYHTARLFMRRLVNIYGCSLWCSVPEVQTTKKPNTKGFLGYRLAGQHWEWVSSFLVKRTHLNIRYSWDPPAPPTKKFTAKRFQFLGMMTREYLDQIRPTDTGIWSTFMKMCENMNKNSLVLLYWELAMYL